MVVPPPIPSCGWPEGDVVGEISGLLRAIQSEAVYLRDRAFARHRSVATVQDVAREWHRHTERNWIVLRQIIAETEAAGGFPLRCHLEKLRYVDHRALFDADRRYLLEARARRMVNRLEPVIRNANLEIEELLRAAEAEHTEWFRDAAKLVLRKFQYLYVAMLPSLVDEEDRGDWPRHDGIHAARAAEERDRGDREDIV